MACFLTIYRIHASPRSGFSFLSTLDGIILHGAYGTCDLGYRADTTEQEDIVRNMRRESVLSALCSMTPGSSGELHVILPQITRS